MSNDRRTRLSDLTDHLFTQLERLSNGAVQGDALAEEVKRTEAVVAVAREITKTADTQLTAARLFAEHGPAILGFLPQIGEAVPRQITKAEE